MSQVKLRTPSLLVGIYGIIAVIYVLLTMFQGVSKQTLLLYKLTSEHYHLLLIGIVVPVIIIWFLAVYGYLLLTKYCRSIKGSKEAKAFSSIAFGFGWLAWGFPINGTFSAVLNIIASHHVGFTSTAVILHDYFMLVMALGALHFISASTHRLSFNVKPQSSLWPIRVFMLLFLMFAVAYTYIIVGNFATNHLNGLDPYRLPHWVVLLTYVAPYLYIWFVGLWSVMELAQYQTSIKGIVYNYSFRYLATGFAVVILSSISIQYVNSVSPRLHTLDLNKILLILVGLLVLYAVGVIFVATGARKLQKIEEV